MQVELDVRAESESARLKGPRLVTSDRALWTKESLTLHPKLHGNVTAL